MTTYIVKTNDGYEYGFLIQMSTEPNKFVKCGIAKNYAMAQRKLSISIKELRK